MSHVLTLRFGLYDEHSDMNPQALANLITTTVMEEYDDVIEFVAPGIEFSRTLHILRTIQEFVENNVLEDRLEYSPEDFVVSNFMNPQEAQTLYEIMQLLQKVA